LFLFSRCILTPNSVEFDRIYEAVTQHLQSTNNTELLEKLRIELHSDNEHQRTRALSLALGGVTIFRKGQFDTITVGSEVYQMGNDCGKGSPKRCGGQGDILAGCLAVALHWASKVREKEILRFVFCLTFFMLLLTTLLTIDGSR
jgi:ATP-dependent NAD(P)H-hydrate dehydratase